MIKLLFLFLLGSVLSLNAQKLSLQECIDKTLKSHPDIESFTLKVSQNRFGTKMAEADYMPQVTLNAEYDPLRTYILPQNGVFNTIDDDNWQAGVVLNQKIWDFSKTDSTIKAYEKEEDISKLSLTDAKALITYGVKTQYGVIVLQTKAVQTREQDLLTKEELYKQAQALVDEGIKTTADASSFLSAIYIAKDELAITKANLEKARALLSIYIGEKIDADVIFEDTVISHKDMPKIDGDLLYKDIFTNNPQLQTSNKEIDKSKLIYNATKAQKYGSIDAVASYTYQDSLNGYDSSLVGVTLTIPIYSGGRIDAQAEQAQIANEIAIKKHNSKILSIREEFDSLMIDLRRYEHTIKAKESLIESSQDAKKVLEARYKEGLSTYIEVLDATSTYLNAKLGLFQAEFDKSKILNRLDYLQGKTE